MKVTNKSDTWSIGIVMKQVFLHYGMELTFVDSTNALQELPGSRSLFVSVSAHGIATAVPHRFRV